MDSTSNGLTKLLPKSITAKRRRNRASSVAEADRETSAASEISTTTSTTSTTSTTDGAATTASTLTLSDSDPDSSNNRPTAISTHPSQIGHLTTSSPLVQAVYKPEAQSPNGFTSELSRFSTRSSTRPADDTDSLDSASSSLRQSRTLALPESKSKRNSSASRLRDVFRSKKSSDKGSSDEKSLGGGRGEEEDGEGQSSSTPRPRTPNSEPEPQTSGGRNRRPSRGPKLEPLIAPPQTPPSVDGPPPIIVNTPPTPTEPQLFPVVTGSSPRQAADASPVGNMITQRRRAGSSAGPSKLSTITPAPLTPTPEKADNGPVSPNPAATFFSSMFTAVQNTANNLSNTISNTNLAAGQNKNRSAPASELSEEERERDQQENVEVESSTSLPDTSTESKEPAVKTLGMGDLSLSQLGIPDPASSSPSPVASRFTENESRYRSDSAPTEAHGMDIPDDPHLARPRSLYEPGSGDRTPPTGSVYEGKTGGVHRSGSIRSALGNRRKRGSSIATHNSAAAAGVAAAAGSAFGNPSVGGSTAKLTGFAVANKKRNRDFHVLFKSVPDEDYLIEDYSCALQREILAHGRLYISEGHLCFSSNILGWVTTLVMSFDEIVSVEKRSTALVFKNGLEISTLHAKHIFASFASRDTTYDLIIKIWKLGHPQLESSLNGVKLEEPGGDRTVKIEAEPASVIGSSHSVSASDDDSEDGDDVYDEDEEDEDDQEAAQPSENVSEAGDKAGARKVSSSVPAAPDGADNAAPAAGGDFPGPATHAPTDCGDSGSHFEKILADETIPAPLGKVYNLLFGPASADWMGKFITGDQKCTELTMEDKSGLTDAVKSRNFTYIKPLAAPIGPKQTKCIVTETLEGFNLEKSVNVLCTTQNPDVPNGNIFVVKTRYCLTWGENNGTRIQVNCTIEWSGKSWLKGPIERGANEGQTQYCKDLFAALRGALSSKARAAGAVANGAGARKKRNRKSKSALASNPASDNEGPAAVSTKQSWGIFEPARPILGPVVDTLRPIITGNVVYGLLVGLLVASWFGFGTRQGGAPYGRELGYLNYPQRMAAYEEMWRREESDLWDWIEERAGLERLNADPPTRKRTVNPRTVEEKLREQKMDERELQEAIRVTEEHLQVLKSVVEKGAGSTSSQEERR